MRYNETAAPGEFVRAEYTPARLATLESEVFVPVLQALAVGAAVGLAAGVLVLTFADRSGGELWSLAGRAAAGVGALALAGTVVWFVIAGRRALWSSEHVIGYDAEPDNFVEAEMVRIEVHGPDPRKIKIVDLAISAAKLRAMAAALHNGKPLSRAGMKGVLSQLEARKVIREMVRRGLARNLPGNKRELTAAGRAVMKRVLSV